MNRTSDDGGEYGLHLRRRSGDHLENLTRRREISIPCLELLEEPHVLDRDDGLIGEGLEKGNLLVGERAYFGPADVDDTDGRALPHERSSQKRLDSVPTGSRPAHRELGCLLGGAEIVDMERLAVGHRAPCNRVTIEWH